MASWRRILAAVLLLVLLATGCTKVVTPTQVSDLKAFLGKPLLYLGTSGTAQVFADPADQARIYAVPPAGAALFAGLTQFAEIRLAALEGTGQLHLESVTPAFVRNVPVLPASSDKEAARLYPPALMDRMLFTSYAEFAVESYVIKSSKLAKVTGAVAVVEFVVDLKPVGGVRSEVQSRWGTPGADGFVRGKRLVLTLYRNGGQYCAYRADWREIFVEGTPPVAQTPPETVYKPVPYENLWEALMQGKVVERVLFEDETYSYLTSTRLGPAERFFGLTFVRLEHATGKRSNLAPELVGSAEATVLGRKDSTLFVQLLSAEPYSEYYSGPIGALDLKSGTYAVLLEGQTDVLGQVAETIYISYLFGPDIASPSGIQALNLNTGESRRVSDLPEPTGVEAYYYAGAIQYALGSRLFILWLTEHPGGYVLYSIDLATGTVQKVNAEG